MSKLLVKAPFWKEFFDGFGHPLYVRCNLTMVPVLSDGTWPTLPGSPARCSFFGPSIAPCNCPTPSGGTVAGLPGGLVRKDSGKWHCYWETLILGKELGEFYLLRFYTFIWFQTCFFSRFCSGLTVKKDGGGYLWQQPSAASTASILGLMHRWFLLTPCNLLPQVWSVMPNGFVIRLGRIYGGLYIYIYFWYIIIMIFCSAVGWVFQAISYWAHLVGGVIWTLRGNRSIAAIAHAPPIPWSTGL